MANQPPAKPQFTSKCGSFRNWSGQAVRRHEIYCHKCALIFAGRAV